MKLEKCKEPCIAGMGKWCDNCGMCYPWQGLEEDIHLQKINYIEEKNEEYNK